MCICHNNIFLCYKISGEVSGDVVSSKVPAEFGVATIAYIFCYNSTFFCYELSSEVSLAENGSFVRSCPEH
jgi:hypothetical protein